MSNKQDVVAKFVSWNDTDFCCDQKQDLFKNIADNIWESRMKYLMGASEDELLAFARKSKFVEDLLFYELCIEVFHKRQFTDEEWKEILTAYESERNREQQP